MSKIFLCCLVAMSVFTGTSQGVFAEDVVLDPATVEGIDPDKATAKAEAHDLLDDEIEDVEGNLPNGWEVIGVNVQYDWDGIVFEIKYEIIISDGQP